MTSPAHELSPIKDISLVYCYYENPQMLERLVRHLNGFSEELRQHIELVIVDDGSPENPAAKFVKPTSFPLRIFRVGYDKPWNQSGARNIGAFEAANEWLLLLDMDMEIPEETLIGLFEISPPTNPWYLFSSRPVDSPEKNLGRHHNAIFMSKNFYWQVGGFDENFDGYYGTAQFFGIASEKIASWCHLETLWIDLVGENVVGDANTRGLVRKAAPTQRVVIWTKRIARALDLIPRKTLSHPYTRVL